MFKINKSAYRWTWALIALALLWPSISSAREPGKINNAPLIGLYELAAYQTHQDLNNGYQFPQGMKNIGFYNSLPVKVLRGQPPRQRIFLDVIYNSGEYYLHVVVWPTRQPLKPKTQIYSVHVVTADQRHRLARAPKLKLKFSLPAIRTMVKLSRPALKKLLTGKNSMLEIRTRDSIVQANFSRSCSENIPPWSPPLTRNDPAYYIAPRQINSFCDKLKYALYTSFFTTPRRIAPIRYIN